MMTADELNERIRLQRQTCDELNARYQKALAEACDISDAATRAEWTLLALEELVGYY